MVMKVCENSMNFGSEKFLGTLSVCSYRSDTQAEVELVQKIARSNGAFDAVICNHWAQGGLGAKDLADAVDKATQQPSNFQFLYDVKVRGL